MELQFKTRNPKQLLASSQMKYATSTYITIISVYCVVVMVLIGVAWNSIISSEECQEVRTTQVSSVTSATPTLDIHKKSTQNCSSSTPSSLLK